MKKTSNKIIFSLTMFLLSCAFNFIIAQQSISGNVVDENGEPVIGASVYIDGKDIGTITNIDGHYTISASSGEILVFSYLGYKSISVTVGSNPTIDVELQVDSQQLDEVVVTGYGTQKRSDITGSISSLSTKDFEDQPVQFTRQALQGRTAGVQVSSTSGAPGNTGTIKIRGVNSISNSSDPLVVVDGVLGASLPAIHPSDIKSIEVLKDASATALYGSRGANGVILVTTKQATGKTKINVSSNLSAQSLPKKIDLLNGAQFAQIINASRGQEIFSPQQISQLESSGGTDWQDELYREGTDALIQNYHVSASGKEGKIGYYLAGNLIDNQGIIPNSFYERKSLRANITTDVSDKITIGAIIQYSDELARNAFNGSNEIFSPAASALLFAPSSPIFDDMGNYVKSSGFGLSTNPLGSAFGLTSDIFTDNTTLNLNLNYKITDNLDYTARVANAAIKTTTGRFQNNDVSNATASASVFNNNFSRFQHTHILTWKQQVTEDHNLSIKGVFEETDEENLSVTAAAGDLTNLTGFYYNLAFGTQTATAGQNNVGIRSYLGRLDYEFKDMILLTATYRADGSSKFLEENRWGYFPSVALGIVPFVKDEGTFTRLKVRGSWGQVGNEGIAPFSTFGSLNTSPANNPSYDGQSTTGGIAPGALNNPDLKWETTTQIDVGFDAEFLEGRFNLSFDYFKKNTTDLLLARTLPPSFGPASRLENVGEIENTGIEVVLDAIVMNTQDFRWDANFNISTAKTILVDAGGQESITPFVPFRSSNALPQQIMVGEQIGIIRGYNTLGVWKSSEAGQAAEVGAVPGDVKYEDVNNDGMINTDDITVIGNGAPDFIWGLNNIVSYKDFTFNMFFQSMMGNDILNWSRSIRAGAAANGALTDAILLEAWTPQNEDTDIPSVASTFFRKQESSAFIEDGSFVRLKNVSLSYNLPVASLQNIGIDRATITLSGQNVFTITDYKGYDPEVNSGGASNTDIGFDTGVYPNPKSWTIGLNVTF